MEGFKNKKLLIAVVAVIIVVVAIVGLWGLNNSGKPLDIGVAEMHFGLSWGMDKTDAEEIMAGLGYMIEAQSDLGTFYSMENFQEIKDANGSISLVFDENNKLKDIAFYFKAESDGGKCSNKLLLGLYEGHVTALNNAFGESYITAGEWEYWMGQQTTIGVFWSDNKILRVVYTDKSVYNVLD